MSINVWRGSKEVAVINQGQGRSKIPLMCLLIISGKNTNVQKSVAYDNVCLDFKQFMTVLAFVQTK